jgi:hypothetical protein
LRLKNLEMKYEKNKAGILFTKPVRFFIMSLHVTSK